MYHRFDLRKQLVLSRQDGTSRLRHISCFAAQKKIPKTKNDGSLRHSLPTPSCLDGDHACLPMIGAPPSEHLEFNARKPSISTKSIPSQYFE